MNILMLSWRGPGHPLAGGAEQSSHEHAKGWIKKGHKVWLFTSFYKGAKKNEVINGVNIIRSGGDVLGVQIKTMQWYLFGKHPKFDLVVDEFHGIPFFTPIYVRTKKLGWIHEVAKEVWWFNPWPKPFNLIPAVVGTVFERFIFSILYKNIPFMTVSESTKRELTIWGIAKQKITVINNGVSLEKPPHQNKEKVKTAMYLGVLTRDKGIEDAINAFSLIDESDQDWQFWVVGKGDEIYLNYLRNLIKKLKIDDRTKFWGFVDQKKKFELLARSHVLLNPSVREGWGLVNIEANLVGTPVIGYKVPGMVDSVKNGVTGILVGNGDVKALVVGVLNLVNDSNLYTKIQKAAMNWSKEFDWKTSSEKSLKLIESL